jgi:DNA-directed RNA polymerase specialized sigma24 family protein
MSVKNVKLPVFAFSTLFLCGILAAAESDMHVTDIAFGAMVRQWRRPVFALLARITGQPTSAETLAQSTFAAAYAEISRLGVAHGFERRLLRIATGVAIDFLRRSPAKSFPALDALSPEQRALVILAEVEKYPNSDLQYIFSLSAASLDRHLTEVRAALSANLQTGSSLTVA